MEERHSIVKSEIRIPFGQCRGLAYRLCHVKEDRIGHFKMHAMVHNMSKPFHSMTTEHIQRHSIIARSRLLHIACAQSKFASYSVSFLPSEARECREKEAMGWCAGTKHGTELQPCGVIRSMSSRMSTREL